MPTTDSSIFGETWRPIPGYPGYEASDRGRILSLKRKKARVTTGTLHAATGYLCVSVAHADGRHQKMAVHRLVGLAFFGPLTRKDFINHKDRCRTNNLLTNLEVVTHAGNMTHWRDDDRLRGIAGQVPAEERDAFIRTCLLLAEVRIVAAQNRGKEVADMGRPVKFPPSIHHHKRSGQARVRWRGHDYWLGRHGSPEAQTAYADLIVVLAAGETPGKRPTPRALTVADIVMAWEREERPRYDPRGREPAQFKSSLEPLVALFGALPASEFDANRLHAVRMAMADGSWMPASRRKRLEKRKQAVGWCRNVVNRRVVRIRTVWRWAELRGFVPKGSWGNLISLRCLPPNDRRVRHTVRRPGASFADVKAVARQLAPGPRAMLLLQFWSGMRSGEVRIMRACDIDRSAADWVYRPSRHKNDWRGQERAVVLGPKCRALLRPFLGGGEAAMLFPAGPGGGYSAFSYAQAVRRAAGRAGVKIRPYDCRHAFRERATRALSLDHARAAMGHRSVQTTAGYGEPIDLRMAAEAARKLG